MKRNLMPSLSLLIMFMWVACSRPATLETQMSPVMPASMFVEQEGNFCDGSGKDKFAVGYYGSNPLDTLIYLYIVCHQKDTVYRASYPGRWFVKDSTQAPDSVKIAGVHATMRALAEGKLMPPQDSINVAPAGNQPLFGINLPGHVQEILYFSAADKHVHVLGESVN